MLHMLTCWEWKHVDSLDQRKGRGVVAKVYFYIEPGFNNWKMADSFSSQILCRTKVNWSILDSLDVWVQLFNAIRSECNCSYDAYSRTVLVQEIIYFVKKCFYLFFIEKKPLLLLQIHYSTLKFFSLHIPPLELKHKGPPRARGVRGPV